MCNIASKVLFHKIYKENIYFDLYLHFFNYNLTIKIKTYKMEDVTSLILMLVGGYLIRFSLILSGQAWAKSYSQTVAFFSFYQ